MSQHETTKAMTATIRAAIKAAGIKARVAVKSACGSSFVQVSVPNATTVFTQAEAEKIAQIVVSQKMTAVRGLPITCESVTTAISGVPYACKPFYVAGTYS